MSDDAELIEYMESLDAALTAFVRDGDDAPMFEHCTVYGLTVQTGQVWPVSLYKVATARKSLPMDIRSRAKRWLLEHGFKPLDDGDVPV